MDVVLDSNILRHHFSLNGSPIDLLVDYVTKTRSRVVLCSIVLEEARHNYRVELLARIDKLKAAEKSLRGIPTTIAPIAVPSPDIEGEVNHYVNCLHARLCTKPNEVVPYKNEYLPDIVSRAVDRRRPMHRDGQQFRDALLWLTVLDYAETSVDKRVVFVSSNSKEFADGAGSQLAPELIEEAKARKVEVVYFTSIDELIKSQAARVEFITAEWVKEKLDFGQIEAAILSIVEQRAIDRLTDALELTGRDHISDPFEPTGWGNVETLEYYVYEKIDGTLVLNVDVLAEYEFSVHIERHTEEHSWEYVERITHDGDLVQEPEVIRNTKREHWVDCKYVTVSAQISGEIIDDMVVGLAIVDWDWG
ncbi:MAG: PIN domain-containing protein [Flavobacteriales bacterium]|nr:MAG: PIN domain-containing protein [Flavobacteriales bacterium]